MKAECKDCVHNIDGFCDYKGCSPVKRKRPSSEASTRLFGAFYLGSITDERLPSGRFRGAIKCLCDGKWECVAYIYGDTLELMRARKHAMLNMLENHTPNASA